ncbi:hypothetical protein I4F81_009101 [Pyropia yezoensis]|uniref:Uncharacterized protein n=1 Tax=Pyropia yezoensis TaxID=2788 RepID=A0ACC3C9E0_PYRYE|nr:hypothetical protein I4F81_009101 [Neopyropia yezoensis]
MDEEELVDEFYVDRLVATFRRMEGDDRTARRAVHALAAGVDRLRRVAEAVSPMVRASLKVGGRRHIAAAFNHLLAAATRAYVSGGGGRVKLRAHLGTHAFWAPDADAAPAGAGDSGNGGSAPTGARSVLATPGAFVPFSVLHGVPLVGRSPPAAAGVDAAAAGGDDVAAAASVDAPDAPPPIGTAFSPHVPRPQWHRLLFSAKTRLRLTASAPRKEVLVLLDSAAEEEAALLAFVAACRWRTEAARGTDPFGTTVVDGSLRLGDGSPGGPAAPPPGLALVGVRRVSSERLVGELAGRAVRLKLSTVAAGVGAAHCEAAVALPGVNAAGVHAAAVGDLLALHAVLTRMVAEVVQFRAS